MSRLSSFRHGEGKDAVFQVNLISSKSKLLLQHRIPWCIFPIPPAPAVFDQCVIDVGAIGQEYIGTVLARKKWNHCENLLTHRGLTNLFLAV